MQTIGPAVQPVTESCYSSSEACSAFKIRMGRKNVPSESGLNGRIRRANWMKNPDVTLLLQQAGQGDKSSEAKLLELVYTELKKLAANQMRRERKDHTLRPSALVNE